MAEALALLTKNVRIAMEWVIYRRGVMNATVMVMLSRTAVIVADLEPM